MTDKVLCPWCGAEMEYDFTLRGSALARTYVCPECGANSPKIVRNCLDKTPEELDKEVEAAALRRYTPPIKPMTLKEIKAAKVVWIEDPEVDYEKELYPAIYWGVGNVEWAVFIADIDDGNEQGWYYMPDYGKMWRAWERKPTDEERSAAGWET